MYMSAIKKKHFGTFRKIVDKNIGIGLSCLALNRNKKIELKDFIFLCLQKSRLCPPAQWRAGRKDAVTSQAFKFLRYF